MAGSVNKVILIGNVGADPEIRRTQDGRAIANIRLATSENWRDKTSGEKREKTEWHRIVIFSDGLCKVVEQYVKKGAKLYVEGQLQTRKWQDKEGRDQYTTEVVLQGFNSVLTMLDGGRAGAGAGAGAGGGMYEPGQADYGGGMGGGGGSGGGSGGGDFGESAPRRAAPAAKPAQKGGFDKKIDDEIPF